MTSASRPPVSVRGAWHRPGRHRKRPRSGPILPGMRPLAPLSAVRAFEAAARRRSFKAAAREMNLAPSAVSHAISKMHGVLHESGQYDELETGATDLAFAAEDPVSATCHAFRPNRPDTEAAGVTSPRRFGPT